MPQFPLSPAPGGTTTTLNITQPTVIKKSSGRLFNVSVVVAGTAAGAVYDSASLDGNSVANQMGVIPDVAGSAPFYGMPAATGITVEPGAGQTLAVSWS